MPPNRKRAAPRPRATRTAPYGQIASIEAPTNNPAAPTPAAASTVPARPLGLTSVSMVMSPFSAPAASPPAPSNQPERESNEHEEAQLVQLAVGWASSRKMSLPLFYADLATSYNRHRTWYFDGHSILPAQAERKLQELEAKWQIEPAFRKSYSDSAQAMEVWMRDTRDVEIKEKAKRDKIVKKAEEDREWKLGCEADKERMYQEFLGNVEPRRGPIEVPTDDDVLDETSEDESTDLDVTTADDSSDEDITSEEEDNRVRLLKVNRSRPSKNKPASSRAPRRPARARKGSPQASSATIRRQNKLDELVQLMTQEHEDDMRERRENLARAVKEREEDKAAAARTAEHRKEMDKLDAECNELKAELATNIEKARKSEVDQIVAYLTDVIEVVERQMAARTALEADVKQIEQTCLEKLSTIKTLTVKRSKWPLAAPTIETLMGMFASEENFWDIVPRLVAKEAGELASSG